MLQTVTIIDSSHVQPMVQIKIRNFIWKNTFKIIDVNISDIYILISFPLLENNQQQPFLKIRDLFIFLILVNSHL